MKTTPKTRGPLEHVSPGPKVNDRDSYTHDPHLPDTKRCPVCRGQVYKRSEAAVITTDGRNRTEYYHRPCWRLAIGFEE